MLSRARARLLGSCRLRSSMAAPPRAAALSIAGAAAVCDSDALVIGGGFAGVAAACRLVRAGVSVLLVEQGRGVGGRVATRRLPDGATFDHGCQYLSMKGEPFSSLLQELLDAGVVAEWRGRLGSLSANAGRLVLGDGALVPLGKRVYVGVPSMSAVGRHLLGLAAEAPGAGRLTVACSTRALPGSLRAEAGGGWAVDTSPAAGGGAPSAAAATTTTTRHSAVVVAASANSVHTLASPAAPALAAPAGGVQSAVCHALLVAFDAPLLPPALAFDGASVEGHPAIAWAARDSGKPGRAPGERWVVHSTDGWSRPRRDAPRAAVADDLLSEWLQALGFGGGGGGGGGSGALPPSPPRVTYLEAHRWGAAFPTPPLALPALCLVSSPEGAGSAAPPPPLALAGDWAAGPRAGDAWASGHAAAGALLAGRGAAADGGATW